MSSRKEQMELLLKSIEEKNFDIRLLGENEIWLFHHLKFKCLNFNYDFDKSLAEEQLDYDLMPEGVNGYTEEQWDFLLDNLCATKEYVHLDNFYREVLRNFHNEYPEMYPDLEVLPLDETEPDDYYTEL